MRTRCSAPVCRLQDTASAASSRYRSDACTPGPPASMRHITHQAKQPHKIIVDLDATACRQQFNASGWKGVRAALAVARTIFIMSTACTLHLKSGVKQLFMLAFLIIVTFLPAGCAQWPCSPCGRRQQQRQPAAAQMQLLPMAAQNQLQALTGPVVQHACQQFSHSGSNDMYHMVHCHVRRSQCQLARRHQLISNHSSLNSKTAG